jgi:4-oxalomesaconate hydratase
VTTKDGFGRLLVVSAHAADFVWRAAGYIAVVTAAFGEAHVVCLSYGEHGESPGAWKQPGMTLDQVKKIRRAEAEAAGQVLGATMHFLDQGDYPLPDTQELVLQLAGLFRELQPGVILTHSRVDPYNYDHPQAADLTLRARMVAQAQGRPSEHVRPEAAGHGRDGIPGAPGPLLRGPGRAARRAGPAQRRPG